MFTFSFGSAFATLSWTGEATNKYLTEEDDYKAVAKKGEEGITEAYKAELTKDAKAMKSTVKDVLYAPEKEKAAALLAAYIADVAAAKTAKAASELKDKLGNVGTNIDNPTGGAGALGDLQSDYKTGAADIAASTLLVDVTRLVTRYDATLGDPADPAKVKGYFLPGYGYIENKNTAIAKVAGATTAQDKFYLGTGSGTALKDLASASTTSFIKTWLMDNDYRTAAELETGLAALVNALVPVTTTYVDTVNAEADALQREIYTYADKYDASHAKNKVTVTDLEAIDALIVKINAFNDKYEALTAKKVVNSLNLTDFNTALTAETGYAYKYFDAYCADLTALPLTSKLADADKAKVLDLYKKFNALEDTYGNVWKYIEKLTKAAGGNYQCPENFACSDGQNKLNNAYEYFLKADVKAFSNLADFDAYTKGGAQNGTDLYYFDASEKNVSAMKAQRTAFNALVSDYGYSSLDEKARATMSYALAAKVEAKLLAGEHNQGADAAYDVKDTKKLQAYLNNATLKVTTKALGNSKIRVNARFDAETYKDIVAECGNDYTISYKFYQKSAKATSFKGPKEKSRNYITYTKASLKKGTKYKFQCGVVIKDKDGKVVAEKSYKASTTGSRVCR